MTNEPTSDESATDPAAAELAGEFADADASEEKVPAAPASPASASTGVTKRVTLEELERALAAEPLVDHSEGASEDGSGDAGTGGAADRPGKSVRAPSQAAGRANFGSGHPALNNLAAITAVEAFARQPALHNFDRIQKILEGSALKFSQRDVMPGLEAAMRTSALLDWEKTSALSNLNGILDKFVNTSSALTAFSALDTRSHLLGVMANLDAGAFRQAHLGNLAAAMTALDVNKTLLGGLAANAGIHETLGQFIASQESNLLADFADQWTQVMLSQVEARELLLLKATTADPLRRLLSARPLTAFDRYLDRLPLSDTDGERIRDALTSGRTHGFAVDAFVASDALLSPLGNEDLEEVIDVVETVIIEPWQEARTHAGADLRSRLASIDPKLEEMYLGAWELLSTRRPGYLESSSHLANEVLGRTLRQLAPDADVRAWATRNGHKITEIESQNGQLTRKIRLQYVLRDASRDERNLVVLDVEAFAKVTDLLVGRLNAGKHNSVGNDVTLRANLVAFEAVMLRIFS